MRMTRGSRHCAPHTPKFRAGLRHTSIKMAIQCPKVPSFRLYCILCHDVALIDHDHHVRCRGAYSNPCVRTRALRCGALRARASYVERNAHPDSDPWTCGVVSTSKNWIFFVGVAPHRQTDRFIYFFCIFLVPCTSPPPVARRRTIYTHL